jgi:hypothetical protein
MTPQEKQQIENFSREIADAEIQIIVRVNNHPHSTYIEEFGNNLSHLVPSLTIKHERTEDESELPALIIGSSLYYHAVPLGKELEPFLTALGMLADSEQRLLIDMTKRLSGLTSAALFDVFILSQCPFCPHTVKAMIPLSFSSKMIRVSIFDAELFPEMASARGIQSVPATFLEQSFSWTGAVDINEIIRIVQDRDPTQLSTESLKKMLNEGLAWKVAEMMVNKEIIFPNFMELLTHNKWTVRLGAMTAVEELVFRDPKLALQLEKILWERFPDLEDPVKGDMLYILGETGNHETISKVHSVLEDNVSSDIQEACHEAINTIMQRLA